jgi:pyrimidine-nucleoside phosphorylase/thymidine phosphorylase
VHAIDAYAVGELVVHLGGGRARKEDTIDPAVGILLNKKVGDGVDAGEPLAHLHLRGPLTTELEQALAGAYRVEAGAPPDAPLVLERVG